MKRNFRIIIVLAVVFVNAALVFGQEKMLEKAAFDAVVANAQKSFGKKTLRRTIVTEIFDDRDSSPTKSSKVVTEFAASGAIRWIVEAGGKKIEIIKIDGKSYKRENDGEWKTDASAEGSGRGCGASSKDVSYKVTEKVDLNGKKASLYETSQKMLGVGCGEGESRDEIWTERYWITEDGTLLKTERIVEGIGEKSMRRDRTDYEYDPNIKIEAPIK